MDTGHGIDLDDLDAAQPHTDPAVVQLRAAADPLGDDLWIAVKLPGEYDGSTSTATRPSDGGPPWRCTPTNWDGCARP
jgi:hypothetical protein